MTESSDSWEEIFEFVRSSGRNEVYDLIVKEDLLAQSIPNPGFLLMGITKALEGLDADRESELISYLRKGKIQDLIDFYDGDEAVSQKSKWIDYIPGITNDHQKAAKYLNLAMVKTAEVLQRVGKNTESPRVSTTSQRHTLH